MNKINWDEEIEVVCKNGEIKNARIRFEELKTERYKEIIFLDKSGTLLCDDMGHFFIYVSNSFQVFPYAQVRNKPKQESEKVEVKISQINDPDNFGGILSDNKKVYTVEVSENLIVLKSSEPNQTFYGLTDEMIGHFLKTFRNLIKKDININHEIEIDWSKPIEYCDGDKWIDAVFVGITSNNYYGIASINGEYFNTEYVNKNGAMLYSKNHEKVVRNKK
jgi:hypothetical protein